MAFEIHPLPYAYNALEPYIDAQTVELHYSKHHATYLKNLNTALEKYPQFFDLKLEQILERSEQHSRKIFAQRCATTAAGIITTTSTGRSWGPNAAENRSAAWRPRSTRRLEAFASFKEQLEKAGLGRFGSGWAWLSRKSDGGAGHPFHPQPGYPSGRRSVPGDLAWMCGNMPIT